MSANLAQFIGRPYVYGARGPDAFDCWGLVLALRRELGLAAPPDFATRTLAPALERRLALAAHASCELERPRAGAIVIVERRAHAGVIVAGGQVVHALAGAGVVAWPLARWRAMFADSRFYEWPPASSS